MMQKVAIDVRRFIEQARVSRVGAPSKTTAEHLQFFARAQVLERHHAGNSGCVERALQGEVQDALAVEYGFSQNPTGEHGLKSTRRSVRRAVNKSEEYLKNRLDWAGDCIILAGGKVWCVVFVRGFNPFFPGGYDYTPVTKTLQLSLAPPSTWLVVSHWEYMESIVSPDKPAEIGIQRRVEKTMECRPFCFSLTGISVP
jgi:hypothetical protein